MSNLPYIIDEASGLTTARDPMILVVGDTYYLTGTQPPYWEKYGTNYGVHLWSSKDLKSFTDHGLILDRNNMTEDFWGRDRFWAPELFDGGDGWFYLTFNCRNESEAHPHFLAVGLARSRNVTGPYEIVTGDRSLTEDYGAGNDGSLFRDDDGTLYLACNIHTEKFASHQSLHKLNPETGEIYEHSTVVTVGKEGEWDSIGVEGACIVKRHGIYFHWYSSWTNGYNAGLATATDICGPWKKSLQNPILKDNDIWCRAGHNHSFRGLDGKDYIIFHALPAGGDEKDPRRIFIRRIDYLPDGTVKLYENVGFGE